MSKPVDLIISQVLKDQILELEALFDSDVFSFFGAIVDGSEELVLKVIEEIAKEKKRQSLTVILTTPGGSAETVERYVNIIRHHYQEVNFVVPDYAFSAGTIFCMSGDKIFMDYYSVLGPIDPQIKNKEGRFVGALGYLDKINELLDKARDGTLTQAEFIILKEFDLAELKGYEQAKELTVDLLKRWLVKYKFKNWEKHSTTPGLIGSVVTTEQKEQRAEEIASKLSDHNLWKSHGRPINIHRLKSDLKLIIEDYSDKPQIQLKIREYYSTISDYIRKSGFKNFYHTRNHF